MKAIIQSSIFARKTQLVFSHPSELSFVEGILELNIPLHQVHLFLLTVMTCKLIRKKAWQLQSKVKIQSEMDPSTSWAVSTYPHMVSSLTPSSSLRRTGDGGCGNFAVPSTKSEGEPFSSRTESSSRWRGVAGAGSCDARPTSPHGRTCVVLWKILKTQRKVENVWDSVR